MFEMVFPSITRSSKLHIQHQVFVRTIPDAAPPGAQNCTYSVRNLSEQYLTLYVQFWAPDDGRKNPLKHVKHLTEIKKLWNVASCWLYSANILARHGPMNVKLSSLLAHLEISTHFQPIYSPHNHYMTVTPLCVTCWMLKQLDLSFLLDNRHVTCQLLRGEWSLPTKLVTTKCK